MDILLLNILISNHQKFITKRFFLLNRNTPEISHVGGWEWVSRLLQSSLSCSRVPFCPFLRKKASSRVTRAHVRQFSALYLSKEMGKKVCFDRLATKLCFKVGCPIFVTFFKHAKNTGIKRCGFAHSSRADGEFYCSIP